MSGFLQLYISQGIAQNVLTYIKQDEAWDGTEIDEEVSRFTQFYETVLLDYESYFGEIEKAPESSDSTWDNIDPTLRYRSERFYTAHVTWQEFIGMWYRDLDKARIVPLYLLHRKRYYDWFGTKALQATVDMMANKPKEKMEIYPKKDVQAGSGGL